jgi:two-component system, NarL family, sensor histidine kinase DevS
MAIPPERLPAARPREGSDDVDLLRLTAKIVGLETAAVVILDDRGAVVRASWPVDRAGLELPDFSAEGLTDLLESLGGSPGGRHLSAPLDAEGRLEGVLCGIASSDEPEHEAGPTLAMLAGLVGSQMQLDGERRRAEEAGARMASLVDTGLSLSRELRLDDLLARIVEAAREVVGARYAALGVLDADRTGLAEFVTAGLDDAQREAIGELPRGRGLLGALIRDARPLRLERISDDPRSVGFPPNHPPMESFLGVPVGFRGQVFGNLYLTDKLGGPFTAEDEQIALTLASQAAVAVENVRRLEAERRRADELESVQEVARAVLTTLDLDSLLPLVARRARRLTGAETVGVAVRDAGGDELVFRYAHGVQALVLEGTRVPPEVAGGPGWSGDWGRRRSRPARSSWTTRSSGPWWPWGRGPSTTTPGACSRPSRATPRWPSPTPARLGRSCGRSRRTPGARPPRRASGRPARACGARSRPRRPSGPGSPASSTTRPGRR